MSPIGQAVATYFDMIKITHTVFALPFAIGATFLAAGRTPQFFVLAKVILAVFFARTAAMSFNRLVDRHYDARNPRTAERALPARRLSVRFVAATTLLALAAFVAVAWWINPLAFALSPVAIAVVLLYSLTKRFTSYCHVVLGGALALAPVGAWVAVTGELDWAPWVLGSAVLLWTAGFDIIYACLDVEFDRTAGLYSLPAKVGIRNSLRLAAMLHGAMLLSLAFLGWLSSALGVVFWITLLVIAGLLSYEHQIVGAHDLSRVNRAFFTMNGIISILLMVAMILEVSGPW